MLDGLLGRGFGFKCKSLIKAIRARIEVVRRRAEAKQRFLKEDLVKLLLNGLDINAYGRTEEYVAGLSLLSCYDFIEKSCECVAKQVSKIDKQRDCSEECREAVASLMFAAARFSDLPELRDLRDIFQQRYGNFLEVFVNQTFSEKLSSRPPAQAKRLQVLHDITSEFSIKWDSKGFEQRMATTSVLLQVDVQKTDVKQKHGLLDVKKKEQSHGEGNIMRRDNSDDCIAGTQELVKRRQKSRLKRGETNSHDEKLKPATTGSSSQLIIKDNGNMRHNNGLSNPRTGEKSEASTGNKHSIAKIDADFKHVKLSCSPHGKVPDNEIVGYKRHNSDMYNSEKGKNAEALPCEKGEYNPIFAERLEKKDIFNSNARFYQSSSLGSVLRGLEEETNRLKSYPILPPYVKEKDPFILPPPYTKPKEDKKGSSIVSIHNDSDRDENAIYHPSSCNKVNEVSSDKTISEGGHQDREEEFIATAKMRSDGHEKLMGYQDDKEPLPKPRSIRRKHHKSSSSYNVVGGCEDGAVKRSLNSRRKDHSRKGLQMVFNERHQSSDDEEMLIDKLLIHYCKKPSSYNGGKLKKKVHSESLPQTITHASQSPAKSEVVPAPTRSISLPHEQVATPEVKKSFNRSKTFQLDNHAHHVHPKLPDYDDLAARFTSLKGR